MSKMFWHIPSLFFFCCLKSWYFMDFFVFFSWQQRWRAGREGLTERKWRQRSVEVGRVKGCQLGPPALSDSPVNGKTLILHKYTLTQACVHNAHTHTQMCTYRHRLCFGDVRTHHCHSFVSVLLWEERTAISQRWVAQSLFSGVHSNCILCLLCSFFIAGIFYKFKTKDTGIKMQQFSLMKLKEYVCNDTYIGDLYSTIFFLHVVHLSLKWCFVHGYKR